MPSKEYKAIQKKYDDLSKALKRKQIRIDRLHSEIILTKEELAFWATQLVAHSTCGACGHSKFEHGKNGCTMSYHWGSDYHFEGFSEPCKCTKQYKDWTNE